MTVQKIYFDMDGVLADFARGVQELCHMEAPPQEGHKEENDKMWARIRSIGNFYDRLELMPGAKEMFDKLYKTYGSKVEILTGVPKPEKGILTAEKDKINWVRRLLSDKVVIHTVLRREKKNFCEGEGCILIDDLKKNIEEWKKQGGTGIEHKSAEETIRALDEKGVL